MDLLSTICSLPTAPFAEERVIRFARDFVRDRPGLRLRRDRAGNLLIELRGKSRGPRWVFAAHMDHPGFVARRMVDTRTLDAAFRGFVLPEYVEGAKVRFFDGQREIRGTVTSIKLGKDRPTPVPAQATVRVSGPVAAGSPGMFDLGEARTRGRRFQCRAIDDLGGLAGALTMLDQIHAKPPKSPIAVLLTRGEEEGFVGAIAAATQPSLLKKTDRIIAIECSARQPYAPQGAGAIIRVGDRTSIFNSGLTYFLTQQAEDLKKKDPSFKYQRALMPGGTCEATVYDVYGFQAASICVPLGNYHNMDRDKGRLGAEFIDLDDWESMVKLFVHIARNGHTYESGHAALKKRIEKRYQKLKTLL